MEEGMYGKSPSLFTAVSFSRYISLLFPFFLRPDLRFNNLSFMDLKVTTLMDLRARAMGRGAGRDNSAWSRGGAVAGVPAEAPMFTVDDYSARDSFSEEPSVPSISLNDFVGSKKPNTAFEAEFSAGSNGGGGDDAWDPFGDSPAPSATTSAPAPVADFAPAVPARRPVVKSANLSTPGATANAPALKPPAANPRASLAGPIAPISDPFSTPAPAAAKPASAMDDFLGMGASSGAGAQPNVTDDLASIFAAPAGGAASMASSTVDVFSMSAPPANQFSMAPEEPAKPAGPVDVFGSGLVNLDNLTAPAASANTTSNANKPSLGQLAAQKTGTQKNVMAAGINSATGSIALSDYSLGMANTMPTNAFPAQNNMGMGMGMQSNMGMGMGMQSNMNMGMGMQPNMGMNMQPNMGMGMGMGMQPNMGMQPGMGMGMNAQAAAKPAEYNPFDF